MMTAAQKAHMLCCASSFVTAAYEKIRLIPQVERAAPLDLFAPPSPICSFAGRRLLCGFIE
jgi:hypothetical protein